LCVLGQEIETTESDAVTQERPPEQLASRRG